MKCPECNKRLYSIPYADCEWICRNDDCPSNKGLVMVNAEFYGCTQEEINKNYGKVNIKNENM